MKITREQIYEKANSVVNLKGMTGNERLYESGLLDEFDKAKKNDKHLARTILQALQFDELSIGQILGNTIQSLKYPNPWDFPNKLSNGLKNENNATVEYSNENEIAMGGPLTGTCQIRINGNDEILIDKFCGGQPIWNQNGLKLAIPIWERSFMRTVQRIGVFDLEKLTLTKFRTKFKVLDLRTFKNDIISGFDSPIHKTKVVKFDIKNERIKSSIRLK
ncbi:hypothetical protein QVZ41_13905 [Wenyingzhuangia sp. chi5]|uniref:Uncharacterized protein n=1 Tax=Wenyingzhuangia gilva TaxID=3057677 RepID=A0ABT8VVF7_9FLAO|nr:hypothetical protein [Wenyingzhuangia sp. chi5]MDO3695941.1 hypothetical protein [Wenyingzhuangia sp. chi5]